MGSRDFPHFRGSDGRFRGARVNLECVPRLPALAIRVALDDPLRRPYLLIWKLDDRFINGVGEIVEAIVVRRNEGVREWPRGPSAGLTSHLPKSRRGDGSELTTLYRRLPKGNGAELLILCRRCQKPRRYLYRWERAGQARAAVIAGWSCRACAGLSFASEGQCPDRFGFGFPRQDPWDPYVFSSLKEGARFIRRAA